MPWSYRIIINAVSFSAVILDKLLAMGKIRRIPESTLHVLALVGGGAGGLVGMLLANHKIKKQSFMILYSAAAAVNFVGSYYVDTQMQNQQDKGKK